MAAKTLLCLTVLAAALVVAGCSDDSSPTAVVDTMPPAVPTSVQAQTSGRAVVVSWADNVTDADLAGFRVVRETAGQLTVIVDEPQLDCTIVDRPPIGLSVYHVTAVDVNGNESAHALVPAFVAGSHGGDAARD